jgi:HPt (histidine-containing phosphotransfer) domain-containing protein
VEERRVPSSLPVHLAEGCVDRQAILGRVGGDRAFLRELVGMFLEDLPGWVARIRAGLGAGDAEEVRTAAHTLRGSASLFGAGAACDAAGRLEALGRSTDLSEAGPALVALEEAAERLAATLAGLASETDGGTREDPDR